MQDPRAQLLYLIREGQALRGQLDTAKGSPVGRNLVASGGAMLAGHIFGGSRIAKQAGRHLASGWMSAQLRALEGHYDSWFQRASATLEGISVAQKSLALRGNSSKLVSGFQQTRRPSQVRTRLSRGITFLERLSNGPLVYNSNIPELIKTRQAEAADEKRRQRELRLFDLPATAPGIDSLRLPSRAELHRVLAAWPEERTMMESAIDACVGEAPDRFRHSAISARAALESVGVKATGQNEWKPALRTTAPEEVMQLISGTYRLLSSLSHAGRRGTQANTELALRNAIALLLWLIPLAEARKKVT